MSFITESKNNEYLIRTDGQANTGFEYENIIIRTKADGTKMTDAEIKAQQQQFI